MDWTLGQTHRTPETHTDTHVDTNKMRINWCREAELTKLKVVIQTTCAGSPTFPKASLSDLKRILSSVRAGMSFRDWMMTADTQRTVWDRAEKSHIKSFYSTGVFQVRNPSVKAEVWPEHKCVCVYLPSCCIILETVPTGWSSESSGKEIHTSSTMGSSYKQTQHVSSM